MLEISLVLELVLGKQVEALVIGLLLLFNATISTLQERQSYQALSILRKRLTISIRTLRDGKWKMLPAGELVPGDCIYLRVGDLIPADVRLLEGSLLVDKSAITGESLPEEVTAEGTAFAGTIVRRGEASARVEKIGSQTTYGKTAELVKLAATPGHLQRLVFAIVRNLVILDIALIAVVMIYAVVTKLPRADVDPVCTDPAGGVDPDRVAGHIHACHRAGSPQSDHKGRAGHTLERHRGCCRDGSPVHR